METREQRIEKFCQETKNVSKTTTILLWIFGIVTIGLFVASFIVPPRGEIHPSVLRAAALLFAFATLAEAREAIREGLGVKLTHGHTTIEVHDLDGPDIEPGGHHIPGHHHAPGYGPEPECPVYEDAEDEND